MTKVKKDKERTRIIEYRFEGSKTFQELMAIEVQRNFEKMMAENVKERIKVKYGIIISK